MMMPTFETPEELRAWQEFQRDRLNELLPRLSTKDGLVPGSELVVQHDGTLRLRVDQSVEVRPHWRAQGPATLLLKNPELWSKVAIRVQSGRSVVARAPSRGVPFGDALEMVLREGEHTSAFWVPNQERDELYSTLLARLKRKRGENGPELVLEVWQWIGAGVEVDYGHAILSDDSARVVHLDGALVSFSCEEDARTLFWKGVKRKGVSYEKYFRVDAELGVQDAVALLRAFFPIEELVGEYFEHTGEWPPDLSA